MLNKSLMGMISLFMLLIVNFGYAAEIRGLYVTQHMAENTAFLKQLIQQSKRYGINTFVIDVHRKSKLYQRNIQLVHDSGIRYVARIIVFPEGGTPDKVRSHAYWEKKYKLADYAADLGAAEVQLDYIRYNTKQGNDPQNAQDVKEVIKFFQSHLAKRGVKLQIAVFGESCLKPSMRIGQDIRQFTDHIDSVSPMVYPSHYFPYDYHSQRPYETVYKSLKSCQDQYLTGQNVKLIPYIEVSNVRYYYPPNQRDEYIYRQIKAAEDSGAHGWYAWSATNKYRYLFETLANYHNYNPDQKYDTPDKKSINQSSLKHIPSPW